MSKRREAPPGPKMPEGIVYLPDATYGVVRAVGPDDLVTAGVRAVMSNSYHLARRPGVATIHSLGGLGAMMGWDGPIVTDSGGFQAYSLLRQDPSLGSITDNGLQFSVERGGKPIRLTPEKSIQNQLRLGAHVLFCLDDCTHPDAPADEQQLSVARTVKWAKRCRATFDTGMGSRRIDEAARPQLFGVVQGGRDPALRRACAEQLLETGFDGFGFGGWPIDEDGALVADLLELTRELIPREFRMHALGVGHPASVCACAAMGYDTFDSALPTRDARRGRLYRFVEESPTLAGETKTWFDLVYLRDDYFVRDRRPISESCEGPCCQRYSLGYLRHLLVVEDPLYFRLATIHNLTFMRRLTDLLDARAAPDG